MSIPTPRIAHLTSKDYDHVYEPAEDSFILLDALEQEASIIRSMHPSICVEIGSGSGVISAFLARVLQPDQSLILSTDINSYACVATTRTAFENEIALDPVQCNLLDPLRMRLDGSVDIIVFNPPYVPTDEEEKEITQQQRLIGGAWAGGQAGMMVTDQVLASAKTILARDGLFYLVAVSENRPSEILERMRSTGLAGQVVLKRRAGRETLHVLRFHHG